ncbi:transporter substrate-binding domain-containing protein, partial [Aquamicrobium sp.]|uniref:transporter substrate-binding domain-containing protein n=1 Tax=Aquamicrobium sp. TaxID=1872579 RepID=UPI00258D02D6
MDRSIRCVLAAAIALAAVLALTPAQADALDDIRASGKVRIGIPNINPYGYVDGDGEVTGQAPELTRAFFADMGVDRVEPVVTEWGALIGGLMAGRFDT